MMPVGHHTPFWRRLYRPLGDIRRRIFVFSFVFLLITAFCFFLRHMHRKKNGVGVWSDSDIANASPAYGAAIAGRLRKEKLFATAHEMAR